MRDKYLEEDIRKSDKLLDESLRQRDKGMNWQRNSKIERKN